MVAELPFDPSTVDLDALLKRLHLANARRAWPQLCERAEAEQWSCRDFLAILVAEEIGHRQQTKLRRAVHDAAFPFLKTVDDFNFSLQSVLRPQLLGSYLSPEFVTEGRNLILLGKTGRGKTHLAIAIAYRAIQHGATAFFTTAAHLIDDLSAAFRAGELAQLGNLAANISQARLCSPLFDREENQPIPQRQLADVESIQQEIRQFASAGPRPNLGSESHRFVQVHANGDVHGMRCGGGI